MKIAKKLKKNNVAVDIVSFGCDDENAEKLQAFHSAVTSSDNSHYVSVPAGAILSDVLISSPVFQGEGSSGYGGAPGMGADNDGYEFGVDPNLDPELALALRVSMEEERARQNAAAREAAVESGEAGGPSGESSEAQPSKEEKQTEKPEAAGAAATVDAMEVDDEDPLLQEALAISMQAISSKEEEAVEEKPAPAKKDVVMTDEDAQLQMALQMSMEGTSQGGEGSGGEIAQVSCCAWVRGPLTSHNTAIAD